MAVTYVSSDTLTGIRTPLCRTSLCCVRLVASRLVNLDNADDLGALCVRNADEFLETVIKAFMLSPEGRAMIPSKLAGNCFEIAGPRHPLIAWFRQELATIYLESIHDFAERGGRFRDGRSNPVEVRSKFGTKSRTLTNTRFVDLQTGMQLGGGEFVDGITYVTNRHQQVLAVTYDVEGVAAARDLAWQITTRDNRLLALAKNPNAAIEGLVDGKRTVIRLEQLVSRPRLVSPSTTASVSQPAGQRTRGTTARPRRIWTDGPT